MRKVLNEIGYAKMKLEMMLTSEPSEKAGTDQLQMWRNMRPLTVAMLEKYFFNQPLVDPFTSEHAMWSQQGAIFSGTR